MTSPSNTFPQFFLKLLLLSLILSSSNAVSISMSGCQGKCGGGDAYTNIPISFGMIVLGPVFISTLIFWTQHKKKLENHKANLFVRNGGDLLTKKLSRRKKSAARLQIYTAEEMRKVTNNYTDKNVMQRCKPGDFYRGNFILIGDEEREVVVVKIQTVPRSKVEEFVNQLIFLSVPHRNLVRIIGCCLETSSPVLVYELHGDGNQTLLDHVHHEARFAAAAGAARGLAYLQANNPKFHGNFCGGNVLLDGSFNAKLYYTAASSLALTDEKSDVYSFGVVLVELLTQGIGLADGRDLATWFGSLIEEDRLSEVCEGDVEEVKKIALMAARCMSLSLEERPSVKQLEAILGNVFVFR